MDRVQFNVVLILGSNLQVRAKLTITPNQLVFRVWPLVPYEVLEELYLPFLSGFTIRVERASVGHVETFRSAQEGILSFIRLATRFHGSTIVSFLPDRREDMERIHILLYLWRFPNNA